MTWRGWGLQVCSTATCNIADPITVLGRAVPAQGSGADPLMSQYLSLEKAHVSKQLFQKDSYA